jgi:hypothetical protein
MATLAAAADAVAWLKSGSRRIHARGQFASLEIFPTGVSCWMNATCQPTAEPLLTRCRSTTARAKLAVSA